MSSLTPTRTVVNTEVRDALRAYLRFSVRGLSKPSAMRFKKTALGDVVARGVTSIYWRCAAEFLSPEQVVEAAMVQATAAMMLAEATQ